ncbi:MAG TPA: hypothetical protein VHI71_03590 [Actinomycetota bacterium]|nr:hypothetical protein [Actinomycetota bacterium]
MKAVKTIAALIFLTTLGIVLVQPIIDADGDRGPQAEARDDASPPADGGEAGEAPDRVELLARYPKRCTRDQRAATGLVAARRGSTATFGFPDRQPIARIDVAGDVAWSPSGTFLAERGGRVFDQRGNPQGALFFEPRAWQWSPVADCALAVTDGGNLTFSIPGTRRKGILLLESVEEFAVSPNGRRLAAVVDGRGLWIANLRRGRVARATEGAASIVGWFANTSVLYSKSPGSGKLRYATSRTTRVVRGALAGGTLVRCRNRVLLVAPDVDTNMALAELTSPRGRIRVAPLAGSPSFEAGYTGATCSPDGNLIAASTLRRRGARGPLVLLERDGTFVRQLDGGRTANPQWSSDGLVYVKFGIAGRGRLWLLVPGAAPRPTGYRVGAPTQYDWHVR